MSIWPFFASSISPGFYSSSVGVAQSFHPIRRRPRTGYHWATEVSASKNYPRQLAPDFGSLVLVDHSKSVGVSASRGSRFGPP